MKKTSEKRLALSTFVKFMRAGETVAGLVHSALADKNLTVSQFGVLEALYHLGPMCQRDIAQKILKSTANLTTVIDNLERRKLVKRVRSEEDRRFYTVLLTAEGKELMQDIFPSHADRIVAIMQNLTDSEQQQLGRLCKKLAGRMQ